MSMELQSEDYGLRNKHFPVFNNSEEYTDMKKKRDGELSVIKVSLMIHVAQFVKALKKVLNV